MTEYKAFGQFEICHHCERYQLNYPVDDGGVAIWDCTCHEKPDCVHKGRISTYACEEFLEVEEAMTDEQFTEASEYLKVCEDAYRECGMSVMFVLRLLSTYRRRLNGGDRSIALYNDIMEVPL